MKRTFQPSVLCRKRKFGYRSKCTGISKKGILIRRMKKGRKSLSC